MMNKFISEIHHDIYYFALALQIQVGMLFLNSFIFINFQKA